MNETAWIAIIVAIGTVISPIVLLVLQNIGKARERRQEIEAQTAKEARDYARQDLVAARAEAVAAKAAEAATLLVAANRRSDAKLDILTRVTTETHGLVNSQYTAVLKAKLDALETGVVLMKEIVAMNKAAGRDPNGGATSEIRSATAKIDELKTLIAEREKADADALSRRPVTVVVQADERTADATERLADATEIIADKEK